MRRTYRALGWVCFAVYLLVLLRITVFRSDFGTHRLFYEGEILWVPFVSLSQILQNSVGYFLYLLIGNLIWFVPFGLLWPLVTGCKKGTVLLAFCLSLVIEALQFVFGTGVSEVEDLILNTLGGGIGYGLYLGLSHVRTRKRADRKNI